MSVEGIWKVEIQGPYNKEPFAIAFLEKGRYLGGGVERYTIGRYEEHHGVFKAKVAITQRGQLRTMFGSKKKRVKVHIEGKVGKKDDKVFISGTARPSKGKRKGFEVGVYLTRLGALD